LRWDYLLTWAVLSPELIVLEASEQFRNFQWDPALEPVGRQVSELFWELVGAEAGLEEVLKGKAEIFSLENINRELPSGSTLYLSLKAIPLLEQEPGQGLVLIVQDTTLTSTLERQLVHDRNQLRLTRNHLAQANEELQKLNRMKSLFLSVAAHDLRSPLHALRGYAELALVSAQQETQEETKEYISRIQSQVDSLNRLISDFLDLDRIEQGKLEIRPLSCHLNGIVQKVADVMSAVAARHDIQIETKLASDIPLVHADPDRLQQILFNLIDNAIKYTSQNDAVRIETACKEDCALVTVTDHGPGIPESDIPRLFDLYHRAEEAHQSRTKGLGLGLFIVKSLVDLHQGQISVHSERGKGTEFTVSLPLVQPRLSREGIHDREKDPSDRR
jgi:signal transduction histidine kinase